MDAEAKAVSATVVGFLFSFLVLFGRRVNRATDVGAVWRKVQRTDAAKGGGEEGTVRRTSERGGPQLFLASLLCAPLRLTTRGTQRHGWTHARPF